MAQWLCAHQSCALRLHTELFMCHLDLGYFCSHSFVNQFKLSTRFNASSGMKILICLHSYNYVVLRQTLDLQPVYPLASTCTQVCTSPTPPHTCIQKEYLPVIEKQQIFNTVGNCKTSVYATRMLTFTRNFA